MRNACLLHIRPQSNKIHNVRMTEFLQQLRFENKIVQIQFGFKNLSH